MRGRFSRSLPMALALVSLVGAGLACGGPRRGPDDTPTPAPQATGQPASTQEAFPTAEPPTAQAATAAPPTPSPLPPTAQPAPTETAPPQPTAGPTDTAAPQPDPLGDQIEGLLDQFDQANGTAQAEIDELPENP